MNNFNERLGSHSEENSHEQYQRSMQFVIQSISKRYKILVFISIVSVLLTLINHIFYIPTFDARSVVRVQSDQKVSVPILLANQQGMGYMSDSREMSRYIRYLQSETFLNKVAEKIKSSPDYPKLQLTDPKKITYFGNTYWKHFLVAQEDEREKGEINTVQDIREVASKISQLVRFDIENVELITITVNSFNPVTSTVIANAYVEEFARLNLENDAQEIVEVEKFIEEKLGEVKASLKSGEENMVALKEKNHMYTSSGSGTEMTEQIKDIDKKQSELWIQEAENNSKLKLIQQNSDLNRDVDKEVKEFKIAELLKKNQDIARQRENLKTLAKKAEDKFSKLPKAEQEYFALKRQEQVDYDLYASLVQKLNQLEIQKYSIQKKVIVETLAKGASPVNRVKLVLKLLFALLASSFFGVVIALILDWIDPTIKNVDDLQASRIDNIGIIPRITLDQSDYGNRKRKNKKGKSETILPLSRYLITRENPKSIESMSFKYIRARLQKILSKSTGKSKVILVTSATSGDGKSFTSCNLAVSYAQLGKRTLLIDCDFRNPSVNRYFEIPNRKGLASVLRMEQALDDVMVQDEVVPNLYLLPADWGVEDPTELISDERMAVLIDHLKGEFEYIVIDSPPIQMVVDGLILSSLASSIVVVARYRKTLKRLLSKTYSDLVNVHYQKIYGILNDAEHSKVLKFFGDHGMVYGEGYSYGYGKDKGKYFSNDKDTTSEDTIEVSQRKKIS
jgi:capsular exopolysaccharide synthesis family protein